MKQMEWLGYVMGILAVQHWAWQLMKIGPLPAALENL
jgi:hypothetical protein